MLAKSPLPCHPLLVKWLWLLSAHHRTLLQHPRRTPADYGDHGSRSADTDDLFLESAKIEVLLLHKEEEGADHDEELQGGGHVRRQRREARRRAGRSDGGCVSAVAFQC